MISDDAWFFRSEVAESAIAELRSFGLSRAEILDAATHPGPGPDLPRALRRTPPGEDRVQIELLIGLVRAHALRDDP